MRKQKAVHDILADAHWKIDHQAFHGQAMEVLLNVWRTAMQRGEMLQAHRMVNNYNHGVMAERERIKQLARLMDVKRGNEPAKACYVLPADVFGEKPFGKWLFGQFNNKGKR
jgi:hypothetical protein